MTTAHPGYEGGDGHVSSQKDGQQSDIARHCRASCQRHEVVPVVHKGQGSMSNARLVSTGKSIQQNLP